MFPCTAYDLSFWKDFSVKTAKYLLKRNTGVEGRHNICAIVDWCPQFHSLSTTPNSQKNWHFFAFKSDPSDGYFESDNDLWVDHIFYLEKVVPDQRAFKKGKKTVKFQANHAPRSPVLFLHGLTTAVDEDRYRKTNQLNNSIIVDNHVFIDIDCNGQSIKSITITFRCQVYGFYRF